MRQTDQIDIARANALSVVLGRGEAFTKGDPLPPFYHQVYFWNSYGASQLGRDGHPKTGLDLIPDLGLPRRMWAGGKLDFAKPLRAGIAAEKVSSCAEVTHKAGRSGPLAFVTLEHQIWQDGQLCLREMQDLVYRKDPAPDDPMPAPRKAAMAAEERREITFDSTTLFRYSALTLNGHRIHYDLDYARQIEGYDGLVVHGPLLAQLLLLCAAERNGPPAQFKFQATAPLLHRQTAYLCAAGRAYWVENADGFLIMAAEV